MLFFEYYTHNATCKVKLEQKQKFPYLQNDWNNTLQDTAYGITRNNLWYLLRHSNCLIATQDFFKISGTFFLYINRKRALMILISSKKNI
jgi:hypothetical protein